MKNTLLVIMAALCAVISHADTFTYRFNQTLLSEALSHIAEQHPDIQINFICNELDKYKTSAHINTDDAFQALKQIIGMNPVSVTKSNGRYYIEALQHGKFIYRGRAVGEDNEPVAAATVMLLSPSDSTVITYGVADDRGGFSIPCDRREVIAKLSCIGYKTTCRRSDGFNLGNIVMPINATQLQQVSVEGQMATAYSDRTVYLPSSRQKNAAQNAIDLLRQMAIPQININLVDNAVTTLSGQKVTLYINYTPALTEEIEGILTSDVKRVEYLDFPTDPRFQGNEHVINFIMQKYEYGGYTKATASENFLVGKMSSRASLYSKFAYKSMTYDLYVGASNHDIRHSGTSIVGTYTLENADGEPRQVTRKETFANSHFKYNQYPVTFRAIYDSDKVQIANTVGFNFDQSPTAETSGTLSYMPRQTAEYSYNRYEPYTSRYIVWSSNYYFILPRNFHLSVSPGINYGHTSNSYRYETTGNSGIINDSRENVGQFRGSTTLYKVFTDRQNGFFRAYYGSTSNNVSYLGTSPYDNDFLDSYAGAALGYNLSNKKWNIRADAALQWEKNKINSQSVSEIYPLVNVSAGFSPSHKHSFSAFFHFGANYPGASEKTPNVLQQNELMYYTGNPALGLSRQITFNLSYNWMPSNRFSASAFAQYFGEYNLYVPVYRPYHDGMALLRTFETDGDYNRTQIGLSFNYKLLNGNLQLAASPSVSFYRMTGEFDITRSPFNCNASATYYLGNFYFQASYQTRSLTVQGNRGVIYKDLDFYQILAGWSRANWNVRIGAMNLFRSDWLCATNILSTTLYSETRLVSGNNFHRRLNLSVTYTFGYGKKVQRGNEVGEQSGASSAIMK